jgi:hypothetical protein
MFTWHGFFIFQEDQNKKSYMSRTELKISLSGEVEDRSDATNLEILSEQVGR